MGCCRRTLTVQRPMLSLKLRRGPAVGARQTNTDSRKRARPIPPQDDIRHSRGTMRLLLLLSLVGLFAGCSSVTQQSAPHGFQRAQLRQMSAVDRAKLDTTAAEMAAALAEVNAGAETNSGTQD